MNCSIFIIIFFSILAPILTLIYSYFVIKYEKQEEGLVMIFMCSFLPFFSIFIAGIMIFLIMSILSDNIKMSTILTYIRNKLKLI